MSKLNLKISKPNDAWIFHREEVYTTGDGYCNIFVLLDAHSTFCFGQVASVELPTQVEILAVLNEGYSKALFWPRTIIASKKDPNLETLSAACRELKIALTLLPPQDLKKYVEPFSSGFREAITGVESRHALSEEEEELEAFIPDSYSPCTCASGKKFRFCCQPIFRELAFAMCAAEDGKLDEAMRYMKEAEAKVGATPEVLCRYAICWSFFDKEKCAEYSRRALEANPNHPRTNFICGVDARIAKRYDEALGYYNKAIENYPAECRYQLNEVYNNIGTVYYDLNDLKSAKAAWEKGLVLLPSDRMVKENLLEFVYENPDLPAELREISPFIRKFLERNRAR